MNTSNYHRQYLDKGLSFKEFDSNQVFPKLPTAQFSFIITVHMIILISASERSLRRLCFHRCLSVHGGVLCPGGCLCPGGVSVQGETSRAGTCGRYASYWNTFLFIVTFVSFVS